MLNTVDNTFDNTPVYGPVIHSFLDLLAEIASQSTPGKEKA